jgi:phospholipase C
MRETMPTGLNAIDTFIIALMENRSFDHMLGYLSLPGPQRLAVEGLSADPAWLAAHANSGVAPFHFTAQSIDDPPHEQATIALQLGVPSSPGGPCPMNGFVESYRQRVPKPMDDRLVMGYYSAAEASTFDFFARHYMISRSFMTG